MNLRSDRLALAAGIVLFAAFLAAVLGVTVWSPVVIPTWNPWAYIVFLPAAFLFLLIAGYLRIGSQRHRFVKNKWVVFAIGGFVFLVGMLPLIVIVWPSPSYYTQTALLEDNLTVGVRFVSNGPMAAGNPVYAAIVSYQGFCPPWNVTSISMSISGYNRSADGTITVGPTSVDFRTCPPGGMPDQMPVWAQEEMGSIEFYSSGFQPVVAYLNVTRTGGFTNVYTAPPSSSNTWVLPIGPGDSVTNFYTLRLLGVSIIVGAAVAGWFPSVRALEDYWRRYRQG